MESKKMAAKTKKKKKEKREEEQKGEYVHEQERCNKN
jgi:hypothetical protein